MNSTRQKASFIRFYRQICEHVKLVNGSGGFTSHLNSILFVVSISFFYFVDMLRAPGRLHHRKSVAQLYLSCRESLPFYNNFPLLVTQSPESKKFTHEVSELINKLYLAIEKDTEISEEFRRCRIPGRICDQLYVPTENDYFALLYQGSVFQVPLAYAENPGRLAKMLNDLLAEGKVTKQEGVAITLSECASYKRRDWAVWSNNVDKHPSLKRTLDMLRDSRFVVCLDNTPDREIDCPSRFDHLDNRFCDKSIQLCVNYYHQSIMLLCEHASVDGMKANQLFERVSQYSVTDLSNGLDKRLPEPVRYDNDASDLFLGTNSANKIKHYLTALISTSQNASVYINDIDFSCARDNGISSDMLIQLCVYETFRESAGHPPTVFEPISLSHMTSRNLDFINPVSGAFRHYSSASSADKKFALLQQGSEIHRANIKRSKQGLGLIGHLLGMTYYSTFGNNFNTHLKEFLRKIVFTFLPAMKFIYHRDMMVSNGTAKSPVKGFGTICHLPNMIGVGYRVEHDGIYLEVLYCQQKLLPISATQFIQITEEKIREILKLIRTKGSDSK